MGNTITDGEGIIDVLVYNSTWGRLSDICHLFCIKRWVHAISSWSNIMICFSFLNYPTHKLLGCLNHRKNTANFQITSYKSISNYSFKLEVRTNHSLLDLILLRNSRKNVYVWGKRGHIPDPLINILEYSLSWASVMLIIT